MSKTYFFLFFSNRLKRDRAEKMRSVGRNLGTFFSNNVAIKLPLV
jgi:hypothetical protein